MQVPEWTGEVVGKLHVNKISAEALAKEIGWGPKYLSAILNGKRITSDGESKCKEALEKLIKN